MGFYYQGSTDQLQVRGKCSDGSDLFASDLIFQFSSSTIDIPNGWYHIALTVDKEANLVRLMVDGFAVEKSIQAPCDFGDFTNLYFANTPQNGGDPYQGCFAGYKLFQLKLTEVELAWSRTASTMAVEIEPEFCNKDITVTLSDSDFSSSSHETSGLAWNDYFARQLGRDFSISGEACCWRPEASSFANSWLQIVIRPRPVRMTAIYTAGNYDVSNSPGSVLKYQVGYSSRISGHMTFQRVSYKSSMDTYGSIVKFFGVTMNQGFHSRLPYAIDTSLVRLEVLTYDTAPVLRVKLVGCSSELNVQVLILSLFFFTFCSFSSSLS